MKRIRFFRGDTAVLDTFQMLRAGSPVDLSDANITFTIKSRSTYAATADSSALIQLTVGDGITVAGNGLSAQITIEPSKTSSLSATYDGQHDVQVVETDGRVTTVEAWFGQTTILADVSRGVTVPTVAALGGPVHPLPLAIAIGAS